jgi:hypothetical protein
LPPRAGKHKPAVLFAERESQTRAYLDLVAKLDDKLRAQKGAARALAEGAKRDSGRSFAES